MRVVGWNRVPRGWKRRKRQKTEMCIGCSIFFSLWLLNKVIERQLMKGWNQFSL